MRGGKSQRVLQRVTPPRQNHAARIILRNTSNDTFRGLNWLNLASRRKMHKCILVFKCLNNLVTKYLTQYFTRNAMQLGEAMICTHQSLNVTWAKELLSIQGLFSSILYPTMLKVPRP